MADIAIPTSIPSTLTRWIYIDTEHRKTICTSPKCMRAIPAHQIARHCSKKHKKWSSKQLRAFMEFVEQLGWSPPRGNEVVEDELAPHPHLPVVDGLQCQHCPTRFQLLESEAAYQHRLRHGSKVGCMERSLVRIQSWSGEGPYWLVNESECASGNMTQGSSEHGKLEMDEQMDEQADRKVEDLSVYQAGIVDDFIDVDGDVWVLLELPGQKAAGAAVVFHSASDPILLCKRWFWQDQIPHEKHTLTVLRGHLATYLRRQASYASSRR